MDHHSRPPPVAGGRTLGCCHVVALPYPGRGHVNPMLSLCDLLLSKKPDILITFVVTEEWLAFIASDPVHSHHLRAPSSATNNIRFATLPNLIPSELDRAKDFPGFFEAVNTKLELPFERLLDRLQEEEEEPPAVILADTFLMWAVGVGKRRNIPVASLWTQSASMYSLLYHFDLLQRNGHFPADLSSSSERADERVDYIPGVSATRLADLPSFFSGAGLQVLGGALRCISMASKAQFFLTTSFYELESQTIDALRSVLSGPAVYSVGPTIPFPKLKHSDHNATAGADYYTQWLDSQPPRSVLYVSQGSFLSLSSAQLEEIVAGVRDSGVRFLWVVRGESSSSLLQVGENGRGIAVPWCDQLKVLSHGSVGGFWSHCGWNSTLEAVFSGVPMLACPIFWDQLLNGKQIVEDWKMGFRVKEKPGCCGGEEELVTRGEIAELVKKLMEEKSEEGREVRRRAEELRECCLKAIERGNGSSDKNLDGFIRDVISSL